MYEESIRWKTGSSHNVFGGRLTLAADPGAAFDNSILEQDQNRCRQQNNSSDSLVLGATDTKLGGTYEKVLKQLVKWTLSSKTFNIKDTGKQNVSGASEGTDGAVSVV